jgi:hypothetical protein
MEFVYFAVHVRLLLSDFIYLSNQVQYYCGHLWVYCISPASQMMMTVE